jgi:hypothetical protein
LDLKTGIAQQQRHDSRIGLVRKVEERSPPIFRSPQISVPLQVEHSNSWQVWLASGLTQFSDALDDVANAPERLLDVFQASAPLLRGGVLSQEQQLDISECSHQGIVDLVMQSDSQLSNGSQAFGAEQFLFRFA